MTKDLLTPRYKVINTYPFNNHFMLGSIVELDKVDNRIHLQVESYAIVPALSTAPDAALPLTMFESTFNLYPHLFRLMSWWEERKPEEMPQYVKGTMRVYKVVSYRAEGYAIIEGVINKNKLVNLKNYEPATPLTTNHI